MTLNKQKIKNTVFYHGTDKIFDIYSEYRPAFFSLDYRYSMAYGKYINSHRIDSSKPFDTANDKIALNYYNNIFLNNDMGKEAKFLSIGESIPFMDADNFWSFISVEEQIGNGLGYDSIIVNEGSGDSFSSDLSIIPLSVNQIKKVDMVDFEMQPLNKHLNNDDADRLFDLMGLHTHGNCHALTILLANESLGTPMIITQEGGSPSIHSFIRSESGMSIDGSGVLPIYEMVQRYIDCAIDRDVSNFTIRESTISELIDISKTNMDDILKAKEFWNLACSDYQTEICKSLLFDKKENLELKCENIEKLFIQNTKNKITKKRSPKNI